MNYGGFGDGIAELIKVLAILVVVFGFFAIWKFIEIAIWLYHHVSISWG